MWIREYHWFECFLDLPLLFFSFPSRWQEQTFHSWTSILLKWYARKQKIWAAELEFTNNNRCFLCWELLSVRKTDRKLLSLYSSLLRKRIAHNKKYAYTQAEYIVDKCCNLNPTPIFFSKLNCVIKTKWPLESSSGRKRSLGCETSLQEGYTSELCFKVRIFKCLLGKIKFLDRSLQELTNIKRYLWIFMSLTPFTYKLDSK